MGKNDVSNEERGSGCAGDHELPSSSLVLALLMPGKAAILAFGPNRVARYRKGLAVFEKPLQFRCSAQLVVDLDLQTFAPALPTNSHLPPVLPLPTTVVHPLPLWSEINKKNQSQPSASFPPPASCSTVSGLGLEDQNQHGAAVENNQHGGVLDSSCWSSADFCAHLEAWLKRRGCEGDGSESMSTSIKGHLVGYQRGLKLKEINCKNIKELN